MLLSFSGSLATKCMPLNSKPCMVRPTLIDLNPVELNCYLLFINYLIIVNLDESNGSFNVVNNIFTKTCVSSKTKDVNVKVFKIITRINEAKALIKHI